MAPNVEYIVKARDNSTAVLSNVLRQFKGIETTLGKVNSIASGAGMIGLGVGSIVAAAGGALAAGKQFADFAETLDRQARSAGTSSAKMQALKGAFEQAGLTGDDASKAMARLNRAIDEGNPYLAQMGIHTRNAYEAFIQLGPGLSLARDEAERARIVNDLLGKGMVESSGIIGDLGKASERLTRRYAEMGGAMDELATKQALRLDQAFDDLNVRMDAGRISLSKRFVPTMITAVEAADRLAGAMGRVWTALGDLEEKSAGMHGFTRLMGLLTAPGGAVGGSLAMLFGATGKPARPQLADQLASAHGDTRFWDTFTKANLEQEALRRFSSNSRGLTVAPRGVKSIEARGIEGAQAFEEKRFAKTLKNLAKTMFEVEVPILRLTEAGERAAFKIEAMAAASGRMSSALSSSLDRMVVDTITKTQTIGQAFDALLKGIAQSVAISALEYGISLGLDFLGSRIAGPAGPILVDAGKKLAGADALAPAGGDTFFISTLSSKSLEQEILSGELRKANSRIYDIARARNA